MNRLTGIVPTGDAERDAIKQKLFVWPKLLISTANP